MTDRGTEQAARFWDRSVRSEGSTAHAYYAAPGFAAELNRRISGDPEVGYVEWFARRHAAAPFDRALVVGCGPTGDELAMLEHGVAREVVAIDISAESIRLARQRAEQKGLAERVRYRCADATRLEDEGTFDVVAAFACVHHIEGLERFYRSVSAALRPNGLFFMVEYVGPTRFQWTAEQIRAGDELLARLPRRYLKRRGYPSWFVLLRTLYGWTGGDRWGRSVGRLLGGRVRRLAADLHALRPVQDRVVPPTLHSFARNDPTEAIRSGEVLPLLDEEFEVVERIDLGLSLIQPVLNGTASNYRDEEATEWLATIYDEDRRMLEERILPSDFAVVVSRAKK